MLLIQGIVEPGFYQNVEPVPVPYGAYHRALLCGGIFIMYMAINIVLKPFRWYKIGKSSACCFPMWPFSTVWL